MLQANPSLTPQGAKDILRASALDLGDPGQDPSWGAGLLDARSAVAAAANLPTPPSVFPPHITLTTDVSMPSGNYGVWLSPLELNKPMAFTVLHTFDPQDTTQGVVLAAVNDAARDLAGVSLCPNDQPCGFGAGGGQQTIFVNPKETGASCFNENGGGWTLNLWPDPRYSQVATSTAHMTIDIFNAKTQTHC